jgi:hypothetical protein
MTDTDQLATLGAKAKRLRAQLDELKPQLDDAIRAAHAAGTPQVEIVAASGYTREMIRQLCLTEEERAELKARRRKA